MFQRQSYAETLRLASENLKKKEQEISKGKNSSSSSKDVKDMLLDENIRKFKEKREKEKRELEEQKRTRRDNLLKMRSSKATGRINRMLKLTKSSLKSVDEESKNSYLNSVTMQGEYQPDEDDYGYTSQFTSEMHQKFLQKYNNPGIIPENKNKSTSNSILPPESKSLKHKTKNYEIINENHKETTEKHKTDESKVKKRKVGPPPPDFKTLMHIAEANKEKPEPFDPLSLLETRREKEFEFERPMTQKEKEEYRKEKEIKAKVERGHYLLNNNIEPKKQGASKSSTNSSTTTQPQPFKIPSKKSDPTSAKNCVQQKLPNEIKQPPLDSKHDIKHVVSQNKYNNNNSSSSEKYDNNRNIISKNSSSLDNTNSRHKDKNHQIFSNSINSSKSLLSTPTLNKSKKVNTNDDYFYSQKQKPCSSNSVSTHEKGRSNENAYLDREKASESKFKLQTSKSKEYPTQSSSQSAKKATNQKEYNMPVVIKKEPRERPYKERIPEKRHNNIPPNPYMHPREVAFIKRSKQADKPKRLVIESDDEYDSEMDDFIDDSEVPGEDISNMIGSLFKYDRTKYINEDSDDDVMESSFAQTQREEIRSLQIGIKEDKEEELRQIEIEKRKKEALAKLKDKSKR